MGLFSIGKPKEKNYEKLYRVKVEPVEDTNVQKSDTGEVIVKEKE